MANSSGSSHSISGYLTENKGNGKGHWAKTFVLREWPLWEPYILNNPTVVKPLLDWLMILFPSNSAAGKKKIQAIDAMDSKVTTATVQATVLNALSGVFAQGILAYRKGVSGSPMMLAVGWHC